MSTYDTGTFDSGTFDAPGELGGLGGSSSQIDAELTQARSCQMNEAASGGTGFRDGETTWISHRRHVNTTLRDVAAFRFKISVDVGSADSIDAGEFLYYWAAINQDAACSVVVVACDDPIGSAATNSPKDLYDSYAGSSAIAHTSIDNNSTTVANTVDGADLNTMLGEALDNATWTGTEKYIAVVMQGDSGGPTNAQTQGGVSDTNPATLTFTATTTIPPVQETGNAPKATSHEINVSGFHWIGRTDISYDDGLAGLEDQRNYERFDPITTINNTVHVFFAGGGYGQVLSYSQQHRDVLLAQGYSYIDANYKTTGLYNDAVFNENQNLGYTWPQPIQDSICLVAHIVNDDNGDGDTDYYLSGHSAGSHVALSTALFLNDETYYPSNCTHEYTRQSTFYGLMTDNYQFGFDQGVPSRQNLKPPKGVYGFSTPINLQGTYQDTSLSSAVRTNLRNALEALSGGVEGSFSGGAPINDYGDTDLYLNGEFDLQDAYDGGMRDSRSVYNRRPQLDPHGFGTKIGTGRHSFPCPVLIVEGCDSRYYAFNNPSLPSGPFGQGDNVIGNTSGNWEGMADALDNAGHPYTPAPNAEDATYGSAFTPSTDRWSGDEEDLSAGPVVFTSYDAAGISGIEGLESGHDNNYYYEGKTIHTIKAGGLVDKWIAQVEGPTTVSIATHVEPAVSSAGYNGEVASIPILVGSGQIETLTSVDSSPTGIILEGRLAIPGEQIVTFTATTGDITGITPPTPPPPSEAGPRIPNIPTIPQVPSIG